MSASSPSQTTRKPGHARLSAARPASTPALEVSLLLSTYQKPWHLQRVLTSIAMQTQVQDRMELIVTDDGSADETADIVVRFAQTVPFPVRFTTHPHEGFQLARSRNEGVAASAAPYLLFLDGDCLLPPDHVWQHLKHRRQGEVMGGYCVRLNREVSERIDEQAIRSQAYMRWIPRSELRKLAVRDWKSRFYRLLRHARKPKLAGGNIGLWRRDFERVNGYDENFHGWGGEDDDLRRRLVRTGVRINSILRWTRTYHLWHPAEPSAPSKASLGGNYPYLSRRGSLTRCRKGLVKRSSSGIQIGFAQHESWTDSAKAFLEKHSPALPWLQLPPPRIGSGEIESAPEIELAFYPGAARFSSQSECRVLVLLSDASSVPRGLLKQADVVISDQSLRLEAGQTLRSLREFGGLLESVG